MPPAAELQVYLDCSPEHWARTLREIERRASRGLVPQHPGCFQSQPLRQYPGKQACDMTRDELREACEGWGR